MKKNITLIFTAAFFITVPAIAKPRHPGFPKHKPAAPMQFSELSPKGFREKLPIQLSAPMEKIAKTKYRPNKPEKEL